MSSTYSWIIDRARSGEPVPISTDRWDFDQIINYLQAVEGEGLIIQDDSAYGVIWIVKGE
jgi:hypothetical protein